MDKSKEQTAMKQMINHLEEMKSKTTDQSEIYMLTDAWVKAIHLIQVEKEQIMDGFMAGKWDWEEHIKEDKESKDPAEYYNETYGK